MGASKNTVSLRQSSVLFWRMEIASSFTNGVVSQPVMVMNRVPAQTWFPVEIPPKTDHSSDRWSPPWTGMLANQ